MTTRSLIFTHDSRPTSRISNNSVSSIPRWSFRRSQPWPTLGLKSWSFRWSQPTYLIIELGLLLSTLLLLLLTHSVTNYELGPYPRARLSIDLIYTLQRWAHCTHTMKPMASYSHSGGPTAFRQNRSTAMTLSRPLQLTPHWAKSWVALCLPPDTTTTVMAQYINDPTRGSAGYNNYGHTRLWSAYLIRVARAHNLPSLEAPARGTTIDPVRTFP